MDEVAGALTIREFAPGDQHAWDTFVEAAPGATFFHLSGWKEVIERAFRHRTFYLLAERQGAITGVLPLTLVRTKLFGASLISNAFCVEGGPVAADRATLKALEDSAVSLMQEFRTPVLEFRNHDERRADWPTRKDLYASFRRQIEPSVEANLQRIPRKQRAMVRKGIQNGLRSELDSSVDRLFRIYAESVHKLGTPVFSRRYFEILSQVFAQRCDIITITQQGEAVASVLNFYFRDQVLPYYGGGTAKARQLAANDFMYWEVMRRGCERGFKVFDFGRSKVGTGAYDFKRNWGFDPRPLSYQFWLAPGRKIPDLNPLSPKFRLFIGLWKKLPLGVATHLGPAIVRGLA